MVDGGWEKGSQAKEEGKEGGREKETSEGGRCLHIHREGRMVCTYIDRKSVV